MPHAEVTLPGDASSVPTARRFIESILTSWGRPEHGWTAALLITELSANCTLHARTEFTVRVDLDGDGVRLQVTDGSLRIPAMREYGTSATTGRGLQLVDELAADWGVDLRDEGKTVWALLRDAPAGGGDGEDGEDVDVESLLAAFEDDVEIDSGKDVQLLAA